MGAYTEDYWVDMRDLFIHGDQFVDNIQDITNPSNTAGQVPFPFANSTKWVNRDVVNGLFIGQTDEFRCIRQDGILQATILGTQTDAT